MAELSPAGKTVEKLEEKIKDIELQYDELYGGMSLLEVYIANKGATLEERQNQINPSINFIIKKLGRWEKKKQTLLRKIEKIQKKKNYRKYL
ncbi:MAG: hypothetical protein V4589_05585 [Bacteroidota bacterium]